MKNIVLFLMIFVFVKVQAQNYQINFKGKGASTIVDSVNVENLTQCKSISLIGSDTLILMINTRINEISNSADNSLRIYPNPMIDYCLIEFEASAQGEITISLFDIAGKRITQVQEFLVKGQHTYEMSGLGSGIYVLKVESAQYSYSAKIVSENRTQITQINMINADNNKNKEITPSTGSGTDRIMKSLKPDKSSGDMPYTKGDILKLTGFSGIYSTVFMLVPVSSQTVTFNFIKCTDADSNHYAVVQIGTQIWMEENLKTTKYNDGSEIPLVTDSTAWANLSTPGYCWNNNDSVNNKRTYGALYNWYAVETGKLCPSGWHVPDSTEWATLVDYLGGWQIAGGKMKDTCSIYWYSPNTGATNSSGFTALPGGTRGGNEGSFNVMGCYGYWWLATENFGSGGYYMLGCESPHTFMSYLYELDGFSVRCVKN